MTTILFVTPTNDLKAGGEISNVELIRYGIEKGYKIYAVTPDRGPLNDKLESLGVETKPVVYTPWSPDVDPDSVGVLGLKAATVISDIIHKVNADAVVSNTLNMPWGALAAAMTNTPHAWIVREFPFYEFEYLTDRYDFIDNFSNLLIANSKNVANYMKDELGLSNTKHFYSYVDVDSISLSTTDNKPVKLVSISNIHPRKNQLDIVRAVGILKDSYKISVNLSLIGHPSDKDYVEQIKSTIAKHDLKDQISFIPFTDNPWQYVGQSDIFIQASTSESIGRTTTEAMKLGLITVGSDIPGIREAFDLGGGNLYKSGDAKSLAEVLNGILSSPDRYKGKAKAAQKMALNNLSIEACNQPFYDQLNKIIGLDHPRKDLRHLKSYLESLNTQRDDLEYNLINSREAEEHLRQQIVDLSSKLQTNRSIVDRILGKLTRLFK